MEGWKNAISNFEFRPIFQGANCWLWGLLNHRLIPLRPVGKAKAKFFWCNKGTLKNLSTTLESPDKISGALEPNAINVKLATVSFHTCGRMKLAGCFFSWLVNLPPPPGHVPQKLRV